MGEASDAGLALRWAQRRSEASGAGLALRWAQRRCGSPWTGVARLRSCVTWRIGSPRFAARSRSFGLLSLLPLNSGMARPVRLFVDGFARNQCD